MHLRQRQIEEAVQQPVHGVGPHARGQWGRVGDVAEQDGDELALALQGRARGQDHPREMRRRVGGRGGGGRGGRAQPGAALAAEVLRVAVVGRAGRALHGSRCPCRPSSAALKLIGSSRDLSRSCGMWCEACAQIPSEASPASIRVPAVAPTAGAGRVRTRTPIGGTSDSGRAKIQAVRVAHGVLTSRWPGERLPLTGGGD